MILLVRLEVLGQILDALAEQRDLHFRRTGVGLVRTELGDRGRLGLWREGHVLPFEFLLERASIRTVFGRSTAGGRKSATFVQGRLWGLGLSVSCRRPWGPPPQPLFDFRGFLRLLRFLRPVAEWIA